MNQLLTTGIILRRIDYGEADRIITLLTPDHGKLRLLARGVRRVKSKLAGGIELFSISHITYIKGKGDMGTLVSTRLITHYSNIVSDIGRVQLGYELIKQLDKVTEDEPEPEYFALLERSFQALNEGALSLDFIRLWFTAQLLALGGHAPNLQTDTTGQKLSAEQTYNFSFDDMSFAMHDRGRFKAAHIKLLRLLCSSTEPSVLAQVQGSEQLLPDVAPLLHAMRSSYLPL